MGIILSSKAMNVSTVYNTTVTGDDSFPDGTFDYCDIVLSYTHDGRNDTVLLNLWLPTPANFQKRWLSTGGFGYAINSGTTSSGSLPGGIIYGAVSGLTDGGFGSFTTEFDGVFPLANGTANYDALYMFGYQAHHELTTIGKAFTKSFFNMTSTDKLYAYYQACSEGGREGWSQVQRFANDWDGAVIGAPAMRFSFQQVQHLHSNVVEQELDYYPSTCELEKILNQTIAFCDPLDGKTDGVIARSDLCTQELDLDSFVGASYYCAASSGGGGMFRKRQMGGFAQGSTIPAQNGTVSAKAIEVVKAIFAGPIDSKGKQVYFSYQPGSTFTDAATTYNATSQVWELSVQGIGAEFVERLLNLRDSSTLSTLDNVTVDTLKEWMVQGWQRYADSLHTDWPDLTPFHDAGGKILHYHGESDYSIPTASSVRYWEAVRSTMYSNMTTAAATPALKKWYQLYLVPGAGHCGPSSTQPNGPWPQTNLGVMINWVEKGVQPTTLNATHLAGDNIGANAQICGWPLRPLWSNNGTTMKCVHDAASIKTFEYDLDAFNMVIY